MDIPKIFLGTGVSAPKEKDALFQVVNEAIKLGVRGFDTAPSYNTEKHLAQAIHKSIKQNNISRDEIFIQTKIDAWQMQKGDILGFLKRALKKMNLDYLDAVLIHWPVPEYFEKSFQELVKIKNDLHLVRHIGICNVRICHLEKLTRKSYFSEIEIIQCERSPLNVFSEEVEFCKEHGIAFEAYSPLCKFNDQIKNSEILNGIAKKHNKNVGQVVLRWHNQTGAIPIFTSTKISRIVEYVNVFDFLLSEEEIVKIGKMNIDFKLYPESEVYPSLVTDDITKCPENVRNSYKKPKRVNVKSIISRMLPKSIKGQIKRMLGQFI